jgi:hypothetical protein
MILKWRGVVLSFRYGLNSWMLFRWASCFRTCKSNYAVCRADQRKGKGSSLVQVAGPRPPNARYWSCCNAWTPEIRPLLIALARCVFKMNMPVCGRPLMTLTQGIGFVSRTRLSVETPTNGITAGLSVPPAIPVSFVYVRGEIKK